MKKISSLFVISLVVLTLFTVSAFSVFAETPESDTSEEHLSGITGDCIWTLDGTVLTVSGNGKMADFDSPWGDGVTDIIIEEGVTHIGAEVFSECKSLAAVTFPKSLESIGSDAFSKTPSNVKVYIQDLARWCKVKEIFMGDDQYVSRSHFRSAELYVGGELITELVIPEGVKKIEAYAFSGFSSITSVVFPNSLTSIGEFAFDGSSNIGAVTLGNNLKTVGQNAFWSINGVTVNVNKLSDWLNIEFEDFGNPMAYGNGRMYVGGELLTKLVIPKGAGEIKDYAFVGCSSITEVIIESGVKSIGKCAFEQCSSVTTVAIPSSVKKIERSAFSRCPSLTAVTIPEGITALEDSVFSQCTSLSGVELPSTLRSIGSYAFSNCTSLKEIIIPNGVTEIGNFAFSDSVLVSVTIPDSVEHIGSGAFEWSNDLESIYFGKGIKTIASNAFIRCPKLSSVHIADISVWCALTEVPYGEYISSENYFNPFSQEADLYVNGELVTELVIPEGVKSIERFAFAGCTSITSLVLPNSLERIGASAFQKCSSLESITFGNGLKTVDGDAFFECYYLNSINITDLSAWCDIHFENGRTNPLNMLGSEPTDLLYLNGEGITRLVIPEGVERIRDGAFSGYKNLTEVVFPKSLLHIDNEAFYSCTSLEKIVFNEGLLTIGEGAFVLCESLTHVELPHSLTGIGGNAFANCEALTDINIPENVTYIKNEVFYRCTSLANLYVSSPYAAKNISYTWFDFSFTVEDVNICVKTDISDVSSYLTDYYPCIIQNTVHGGETYTAYASVHKLYDDKCDDSCLCGFVRNDNHVFSGDWIFDGENHWKECAECGESSGATPHFFRQAHDEKCYIGCGFEREVVHEYGENMKRDDLVHWQECEVCGEKTVRSRHSYDGSSDAECNECGYVREILVTDPPIETKAEVTDVVAVTEAENVGSDGMVMIIIIAACVIVVGASALIFRKYGKNNAQNDSN